jgi:hypothetical protein
MSRKVHFLKKKLIIDGRFMFVLWLHTIENLGTFPYWRIHFNLGLENGFQRLLVRVYYWETDDKQETDPELF